MKTGYVWIPGEPLSGIYTYSLIASGNKSVMLKS